jgi:hypothetical protein
MAQAPQTPVQYQYIDRPEISETFADFVNRIQFDGQTLRIEFCISRLEDPEAAGFPGLASDTLPAASFCRWAPASI